MEEMSMHPKNIEVAKQRANLKRMQRDHQVIQLHPNVRAFITGLSARPRKRMAVLNMLWRASTALVSVRIGK